MSTFKEEEHPRDEKGRFIEKGKSTKKRVLDAIRLNATKRISNKKKSKDHKYTIEDYNSFGWARVNDVINAGQNRDFTTKFAEATNGSKAFVKTKQGEFMIAISDIYNTRKEGVNGTIVFAYGKIERPIITRILKIKDFEDETTLSFLREYIYTNEHNGIKTKASDIFVFYTKDDF